MNYRILCIALLATIFPATSHAQVLLSEIAWMGTDANPSHEWIELYNFSNSPTDLTGWTLTSEDGAIDITLSGTLSPHGVGVLERDSDSSVPGVTALQIYTGEMSNAGGSLTLKNASGTPADAAPGGSNWTGIGGKSTAPIKTSQRTRTGSWITAAPTPGLENAQINDPVIDTTVGTTTSTTAPTAGGNIVTRSGGGGGSSKRNDLTISIAASSTVYVGKSVPFAIAATKSDRTTEIGLSYYWNFGDAETATGKKVTHSYEFPGDYVVMVESSTTRKHATARLDVRVLPHALALSTTTDGNIAITNIGAEEFILDGYTISGSNFKLVFPKNSILKSKATLTLARAKFGAAQTIEIADTEKYVVARLSLQGDARLAVASLTNPEAKAAAGKRVIPYVQKETPVITKTTVTKDENVTVPEVKKGEITVAQPNLFNRIISRLTQTFGF